jgi:hypothetical protein
VKPVLDANLIAAILTAILGLTGLVALTAYLIHSILRAGRFLDPLLEARGLVSRPYLLFSRRYHGRLEGRDVAITFLPALALQPAQLDLRVNARLGFRAAVAPRLPLLDCGDCPRLDLAPSSWEGPPIWTRDAEGVRRLLADPAVRSALAYLMAAPGTAPGDIYLQPATIWLRIRPRRLTEEQFRGWFDGLLTLARAAEEALSIDASAQDRR